VTRRRWVVVGVVAAALLLLLGREIAGWYVEYRWFDALNAGGVWQARAINLTLLRGAAFLVGFLFIFANLFAVRSSIKALVLPQRVANIEIGAAVPSRRLTWSTVILSALLAALLALMQDNWMALELVRHGDSFRESDPYFQYDLSFFVYWLPLEVALHAGALSTLVVVTLLVLVLYALTPSLRWERGRIAVTGHVRRHFFALGAVLLVLLGWRYRLDAYTLLVEGHGELDAFTALDKEFRQPANLVLALITISAAALVFWSGWMGQTRIAFAAVTLVLVGAFTVRQIIPPILQRTSLSANAGARERPYLETRAAYTRRGFDTERIVHDTNFSQLAALDAGVRGVSAFDEAPLSRNAERLRRRGRVSGSVGWDFEDGHLIGTLAEQPAGPDAIDAMAPWSLARSDATVVDERGLPVFSDVIAIDGAAAATSALVHDSIGGYLTMADSLGTIAAPELRACSSAISRSRVRASCCGATCARACARCTPCSSVARPCARSCITTRSTGPCTCIPRPTGIRSASRSRSTSSRCTTCDPRRSRSSTRRPAACGPSATTSAIPSPIRGRGASHRCSYVAVPSPPNSCASSRRRSRRATPRRTPLRASAAAATWLRHRVFPR
jgi:hypothetical protein